MSKAALQKVSICPNPNFSLAAAAAVLKGMYKYLWYNWITPDKYGLHLITYVCTVSDLCTFT